MGSGLAGSNIISSTPLLRAISGVLPLVARGCLVERQRSLHRSFTACLPFEGYIFKVQLAILGLLLPFPHVIMPRTKGLDVGDRDVVTLISGTYFLFLQWTTFHIGLAYW